MNPLALLASRLKGLESDTPTDLRVCTEIDDALHSLESNARRRDRANEPNRDLQVEAVEMFAATGTVESLREARYLSYGLGIRVLDNSGCLFEDRTLFGKALECIDSWKSIPRQFRKCYQGLVRCYFNYDGLVRGSHPVGSVNWQRLRAYLDENSTHINDTRINPEWVTCVQQNRNVFSKQPCQAYGSELIAGDEGHVAYVRSQLGIDDSSWFTRELIMSQVEHAIQLGNVEFSSLVSRLLKLVENNEVLRDRALTLLLDRYAAVTGTPLHQDLKNQAVAWWGNPWLPSNADRWGGVSEYARALVSDWLKLEFIELFFSKLAEDGQSDTRRVKFWAKYVPSIENIQFALGPQARSSRERDFVELRKKMQGLIVPLDDNIRESNAFIMTMKDLVAVEFSKTSNAFYGYSAKRPLPFTFDKPLKTPVNGDNSLKRRSKDVLWLSHKDNIEGYTNWEDRFEAELLKSFGIKPGQGGQSKAGQVAPYRESLSLSQPSWAKRVESNTAVSSHKHVDLAARSSVARSTVAIRSTADHVGAFSAKDVQHDEQTNLSELTMQSKLSASSPRQVSSVFDLGKSISETKANSSEDTTDVPYSEARLQALASKLSVRLVDQRAKGGALWLKVDRVDALVKKTLINWGFKHVAGKGWWKR